MCLNCLNLEKENRRWKQKKKTAIHDLRYNLTHLTILLARFDAGFSFGFGTSALAWTLGKTHTPKSSVEVLSIALVHRPDLLNERSLHAWNVLNTALKIVTVAISFASVEQNRPIFPSFSWLWTIVVVEWQFMKGNAFFLNLSRCNQQQHISLAFFGLNNL